MQFHLFCSSLIFLFSVIPGHPSCAHPGVPSGTEKVHLHCAVSKTTRQPKAIRERASDLRSSKQNRMAITPSLRPTDVELDNVMASVRVDSCRDLISDIRTGAANEYSRVKRHKQNELHHRYVGEDVHEGSSSRARKKKVDNHASAVASRCKQEFLVSGFENLLKRKLAETELLTAACHQQRATISQQLRNLREKDAEIEDLKRQLLSASSAISNRSCSSQDPNIVDSGRSPTSPISREPSASSCVMTSAAPPALAPSAPVNLDHSSHLQSSSLNQIHGRNDVRCQQAGFSRSDILRKQASEGVDTDVVDVHGINQYHSHQIIASNDQVPAGVSLQVSNPLESHDVGVEMDEIIARDGNPFSHGSQHVAGDSLAPEYLSKQDLLSWDTSSARRQRQLAEEILRANLQAENLNSLNPVA